MRYGALIWALVLVAFAGSLGFAAQQRAPEVSKLRPHRSLDAVSSANRYPWVVGKDWPRHTLVHLTVHFKGRVARTTLRTGRDGIFGVGIKGVRWCTGLVVEAIDAMKYRVVLHGANPFSRCPPATESNRIVIRSLTQREVHAHEYLIDSRKLARSYTIHLGDMLYVYVGSRAILRKLDTYHFRVIERGVTPECPPNADCLASPGTYYYRVVAIRPGRTLLPLIRHRFAAVRIT